MNIQTMNKIIALKRYKDVPSRFMKILKVTELTCPKIIDIKYDRIIEPQYIDP